MAEELRAEGREPKTHELKCWVDYFEATLRGEKLFEIRKDDRDFGVGHTLVLKEWDPDTATYTGREIRARVTYRLAVLPGYPLPLGWVALGIRVIPADAAEAAERGFVIGASILYTQSFDGKAGKRFRLRGSRSAEPEPIQHYDKATRERFTHGAAVVTGWSHRVMRDYWVDSNDEYYIAGGTREMVLLCRERPDRKEFIVRFEDAVLASEGSDES